MNPFFTKRRKLRKYDDVLLQFGFNIVKLDLRNTGWQYAINRTYLKGNIAFVVSIPNAPEASINCTLCLLKKIEPTISFYLEKKEGYNYYLAGTHYELWEMINSVGIAEKWENIIFFKNSSELESKIKMQIDFLKNHLASFVKKIESKLVDLMNSSE